MTDTVKYAIRSAAGWASMSGAEQAEYAGYYTSLASWDAAQVRDIRAGSGSDEILIVDCFNDFVGGLSGTLAVSSAWGTSDTNRIIIRAADGHKHTGQFGTGFKMTTNSWQANLFYFTSSVYMTISGLEIDGTNSNNAVRKGRNVVVEDCLLGPNLYHGVYDYTGVVRNTKIKVANYGVYGAWTSTNLTVENCTAIGGTTAFKGDSANITVKNSIAYLATTPYSLCSGAGSTNNAASDAATNTPPGSSPITTNIVSTDFVDAANDDYSLTSGSTLKGAGADLSGTFTTDILGNTRTAPWDVGAFMYVAAGGGGVTAIPPRLHNIHNQHATIMAHKLNGVLQ